MVVVHEPIDGRDRLLRGHGIDDLEADVSPGHFERGPHACQLSLSAGRLWAAERINRAQHQVVALICSRRLRAGGDEEHECRESDALHWSQNIEPMGSIRIETLIRAPIERCFDLARSAEAHIASTAKTNERVVAGRSTGLFELGDSVTWEAKHFGVRLRQGSKITRLEPPHVFVDEGTEGPLRGFRHVHQFVAARGATLMVDTFEFELRMRMLGRLVDRLAVERHLRRLLTERAAYLKAEAEAAG